MGDPACELPNGIQPLGSRKSLLSGSSIGEVMKNSDEQLLACDFGVSDGQMKRKDGSILPLAFDIAPKSDDALFSGFEVVPHETIVQRG
jgi:hypothetical protein